MPVTDPWLPTGTVPLIRPTTPITVWRWSSSGPPYEAMTSLRCLYISQREGTDPGTAVIRYAFDGVDPDSPQDAAQAISTAVSLPKSVEIGDRLLVQAERPDGTKEWIFDGKPLVWALEYRDREMVTIVCVGIAKACWDTPIPGAFMRHADTPDTEDDIQTDLIAHFNPRGLPNATPADADATPTSGLNHPTFLGPYPPTNKIKDKNLRYWDLPMAARYILARCNDEAVVKNPTGTTLDQTLISREPIPGTPFDPNNASSYNEKPIIVADTPITGRDWPSTIYGMIRNYGFGQKFELITTAGKPETHLRVFLQQAKTPKQLMLQARGATLDPALTNTSSCNLQRDLTNVANKWIVQGAPDRYEASFVLKPGFPMASADGASISGLAAFDRSSPTYATTDHDKYRLFVFDECGEGTYSPGSATVSHLVPDLDDLFGTDAYARRRRKPIGDLISTDDAGKARRYSLSISTDYTGPDLWDGTGTWQPIQGGYELLKDRIGIRITCDHPNKWKIGPSTESGAPYPAGICKVVENMCSAGAKNFRLRLTVVVEADKVLTATAERRDNSPITEDITRVIDARDRYGKEIIQKHSEFNNTLDDVVKRDDIDDAQAEADAVRFTTDSGVMDGSVTIPRFTAYYAIGDRIDQIEGRAVGLRTNTGGSADDAPVLPVVVGRQWEFEPKQKTTLQLSDAGTDRRQYSRKLLTRKKDVL